jgi:hypothetical protein
MHGLHAAEGLYDAVELRRVGRRTAGIRMVAFEKTPV